MSETELLFSDDEAPPRASAPTATAWKILIVDDDPEVHLATRLALSDVTCLGRPLSFLSAHSAAETKALLPTLDDIAIILLDVVMEADDAGLNLVHFVREQLNWQSTRIILRTGQPGSAPERHVIVQYDINDYKAKAELTDARLFTAVVTALRSYRHLVSLEMSRQGLRKVIDAAASLYQCSSMQMFAEGVLLQLTAILDSDSNSILCSHRHVSDDGTMALLAGSGRFSSLSRRAAAEEFDGEILHRLHAAFDSQRNLFSETHAALYLKTRTEREVVVYIENERPFSDIDLSLLELFGHNISIGYDNLEMHRQLRDANAQLETRVIERTLELSKSEADLRRFKSAVEHSSTSILITDVDGVIVYSNPALSASSLYSAEELIGRRPSLFKSGMIPDTTFRSLWACIRGGESWRGELLNRRKNGDLHWVDISISPVTDESGVVTHFVAVNDDISERKKLEDELRRMATIDPLTGVLNRRSFLSLADQELLRWRRHSRPLVAMMIDIDHFKTVNDTRGHQAGDEVLRVIVGVCGTCLRERDIIGRLGGEEFACILPDTSIEQAMPVAERLRSAVADEVVVTNGGVRISVTISVGVAMLTEVDGSFDSVLNRADAALYDAKQAGRNCVRQLL